MHSQVATQISHLHKLSLAVRTVVWLFAGMQPVARVKSRKKNVTEAFVDSTFYYLE